MRAGRKTVVLAAAVAGAALAVLFVETRTVDPAVHARFTNGLRAMAHADVHVNQIVLKSRQGLVPSFDPLVEEWATLARLRDTLTTLPARFTDAQRHALRDRVAAMDERLGRKLRLTDRFKSEQAILRNSLSYFPVVANEVRVAARAAGAEGLARRCDELLLAVLAYHAGTTDDVAREIDAAVAACEAERGALPAAARRRFDAALDHARTVRRYRKAVDTTTRDLVMAPTAQAIDLVLDTYDRAYADHQRRTGVFQNLLFGLAVLLVGWGVYSVVQLRRRARQLRRANETLEERVLARTSELDREVEVRRRTESELREARDLAEQHTQAKSQFLANMSHELRTPLNAIIGYSELLKEDAEDRDLDDLVPDLEKIRTAGKHLLELINGVLDLSKIEAGKMELFVEEFDLGKLVGDVVTLVRPLVERNRNRLVVEGAGVLGTMSADQTKVRQVLFNLMSNACKFTEEGEIRLRCARGVSGGRDEVTVAVADEGIGMDEEQVARVFQAFTQADASTTRRFGGTGLGLTISREFCHMMGGDLEVESRLGEGTTFTVRLPSRVAPPPAADAGPEEALAAAAGVGRRVLVVDDDDGAREVVTRYLTRHGFRVLAARNGEDAVAMARAHLPDAITLDVLMPGMDGWDVLSALQQDPSTRDIPVVVLSVAHEPELAYSLGATAYLTKPVDREDLYAVVDGALGERDAHHRPQILVVDDDPAVRETTRRFLEQRGCAVDAAENGRVGLERALAGSPDLVLLDLMMPEVDGFEFLERLRAAPGGRDLPVVVLTAKNLTDDDRRRLNGRVEAVLQRGAGQSPEELLDSALGRIRSALAVV